MIKHLFLWFFQDPGPSDDDPPPPFMIALFVVVAIVFCAGMEQVAKWN